MADPTPTKIESRIVGGRRVQIGSKAEQRLLNQGFTPETQEATSAKLTQGKNFTPSTSTLKPVSPINVSTLTESVRPYNIQSVVPETQASGFLASIDQQAQDTANKLVDTKELDKDKEFSQQLLQQYLGASQRPGEIERTDKEYRETVDPAKEELDDINQKIREREFDYLQQIKKLRENKGGMTREGVEGQVGFIERQAATELAELSIVQQAKNDRYETARSIADRKIAIELERDTNEINALKFAYEQVKEDFTKAEDRQFQVMLGERERLLEEQAAEKKAISDLAIDALQNGAPASLAQQALKAKTREEALGLVGSYVGALDRIYKNAQIAKIYDDINASAQTGTVIGDSLYTQLKTRSIEFNQLPADQKRLALNIFAQKGETIPRQLTAKEKDASDQATGGLDAVQQLKTMSTTGLPLAREFIFGSGTGVRGTVGRMFGTSQFVNLADEATDIKTRIRTGAQLNEQELSFYAKQRPIAGDSPQDIKRKLDQLEGFYLGMSGLPVTITAPDGSYSAQFEDLFDAKQRLGLRDAINEGWTLSY